MEERVERERLSMARCVCVCDAASRKSVRESAEPYPTTRSANTTRKEGEEEQEREEGDQAAPRRSRQPWPPSTTASSHADRS
eukprot:2917347-Rhodomonas_salina.2